MRQIIPYKECIRFRSPGAHGTGDCYWEQDVGTKAGISGIFCRVGQTQHLAVERLYCPPYRLGVKVAQYDVFPEKSYLAGLTLIAKVEQADPIELEHELRIVEEAKEKRSSKLA